MSREHTAEEVLNLLTNHEEVLDACGHAASLSRAGAWGVLEHVRTTLEQILARMDAHAESHGERRGS